jgi:hypothetical protein
VKKILEKHFCNNGLFNPLQIERTFKVPWPFFSVWFYVVFSPSLCPMLKGKKKTKKKQQNIKFE